MDISEHYRDLTAKMNNHLPLTAFPTRQLVQIFRKDLHPITLKTNLTITRVFNSGDMSGIMCTVKSVDGHVIACALTHLVFSKSDKLYAEIADYQKKREKRIKELNLAGLN